jgi:hypothetical protein
LGDRTSTVDEQNRQGTLVLVQDLEDVRDLEKWRRRK